VGFDKVVPSLEEIDGVRMYLKILAAIHASADKPCQRVANSEIKPFYVRSADSSTRINAEGIHNLILLSKHNTLKDFNDSTFFSLLTYLRIFQVWIRDEFR